MTNLSGLIIGCGSIGERHLHNLKKIGINDIAIYDSCRKRVDELSKKYRAKKFYSLDSALSFRPDFSVICTYPNSHSHLADACIDVNSHLFIEKPISTDLKSIKTTLARAQSRNLKVAVGYNLRFDKGLNFLKRKAQRHEIGAILSVFGQWGQNIKSWRPGSNYKNHYVLKKGGGIILDDSHEYDYIRWLLNDEPKSIFCQTRKIKTVKTDTESLASMMLKFRKGTIVTLLIDYVRPRYERDCHVIGDKGDLKWKYGLHKDAWKNYKTKAESVVTKNLLRNQSTEVKSAIVGVNEMYVSEMYNFIQAMIRNEKPLVDGWEGLRTLQIGLAALESAKSEKVIRF